MKEKWQEIYTKQQLSSIQQIEKKILKEFIRVCNELKIDYFIYGGTLLGQVKYGDIIPWDDDIDVALTRENYNIFLQKAPSIISNKFVIQSPYNEKKTPFPYTKIRYKGTIFIEEFHHKLNMEKGIYIDLYPVDNIPDDETLRKKQWKKAQIFCKLFYARQCLHASFPFPKEKFIAYLRRTILYIILRLFPRKFILKKIDYYMTKYNLIETKRKACLFSPNYNNIYIKLYPLIKRKFGEIDVMIPNCYDDHLNKRYGNYKKDLPAEKRVGHIPYEIYIPSNELDKKV